MIYTLTLNPALDCIITVPGYTEGAVNRASEEIILAGGKGINVSSVLTYLGIENTALGYAAGFTGDVILDMLSDLGVKNDFIRLDDGISRINILTTQPTTSTPMTDNLVFVKDYGGLSTGYVEYSIDISKYKGECYICLGGGYYDSTGYTSSKTSYCNVILE